MNIHDPNIATPKVTTGPIFGSRKVYVQPETAPDLRVPVREIAGRRTCRRATGLRIRSDATEQAMKTIVEPSGPTPSSEANAAAPAASATGPRKKSPGVRSSPTPSATATSTQTSQPTLGTLVEAQCHGQRA